MRTAFLLGLIVALASAQIFYIQEQKVGLNVDSGFLAQNSHFKQIVSIPNADWLRLKFDKVRLADGAYIKVMALIDGGEMILDKQVLEQWDYHTAYFNGNEVEVEVIVPEGVVGTTHVHIGSAVVGPSKSPRNATLKSICGPTDKRVQSFHSQDARLLIPGGGVCSTWAFNRGPTSNRCFGSAGHCTTRSGVYTAQFNVPDSSAGGSINHPPPSDQFASDPASLQSQNGGVGADWAFFGFHPTNGQSASSRFGFYNLDATYSGSTARICGYGSSSIGRLNLVQKIHTTDTKTRSGSTLRYMTDTTGGNSGSAVSVGTTVYGVHTHGGCTSGNTGSNAGTSATNSNWAAALAAPRGICQG